MEQIDADDYMDLVDVARELQVSYSRVWSRVTSGAIPANRTTSGWRVRRADLSAIRERFGNLATRKAVGDDVKRGWGTK